MEYTVHVEILPEHPAFGDAEASSLVLAPAHPGDAGIDLEHFAPRLSFFFNAHNNLLEEVAKFRAARRIWARWMKERYGAELERSMQLRFHTQTAGVSLTAQQPEVNIVRTAIEALAGVLGGTQSLHTNSMDEALALPVVVLPGELDRLERVPAGLFGGMLADRETDLVEDRDPIGAADFARSPEVASPIGVLDAAPVCDGAAAVVVCSRDRVANMLRTLGAEEVRSIIQDEGSVRVACEFCNHKYEFDAVDSAQLFATDIAHEAPTSRH